MRLLCVIAVLISFVAKAQAPFATVKQFIKDENYVSAKRQLDSLESIQSYNDSVLFYKAVLLIKKGSIKQAKKHIEQLDEKYPTFYESEYLKGLLAFSQLNYGKSIDHFTNVIKRNPDHLKALYNRSLALGMIEENLAAIEDLTECLRLDPLNPNLFYSRAYWYEFTGNYKGAEEDYEKTIALEPDNFDAYLGHAFVQHSQNEHAKACETISRAIRAGSQVAEEMMMHYCR